MAYTIDMGDVKYYNTMLKALQDEFEKWEAMLKDISDYLMPERGRFLDKDTTPNDGKKRRSNIKDETAGRYLDVLSAGIQGGMTSPAVPWFSLTIADRDRAKFPAVKKWLEDVKDIMLYIFGKSNFYDVTHATYEELGGFGTGAMHIDDDPRTIIRCYPYTVGEYFISTDASLRVDTIYRVYDMLARNVVREFGEDNVSQGVKSSVDSRGGNDWVEVVHAIEPNVERDLTKRDNQNLPWISAYYERKRNELDDKGKSIFLRKSGYHEFPSMVPRWKVTGSEQYGRGPGERNLGDIKMLQALQKDYVIGVNKVMNPPVNAPTALKNQGASVIPGGVNYVDKGINETTVSPVYQINPDLNAIRAEILDVREALRAGFFTDVFVMFANAGAPQKTATEILARKEEKLLLLGPVINRIISGMLKPAIDRTFGIAYRAGMLPPPPPDLQGQDLEIEYTSPMAEAQKSVGTAALDQTSIFVGNISKLIPSAVDKFDADEAIEEYGRMKGVSVGVIRSDDDVKELRKGRAAAIQQQTQQANAAEKSQTMKTLSETDTSGDNALTEGAV
jgi:hypothetical protein